MRVMIIILDTGRSMRSKVGTENPLLPTLFLLHPAPPVVPSSWVYSALTAE
jgi:hypothetical protein